MLALPAGCIEIDATDVPDLSDLLRNLAPSSDLAQSPTQRDDLDEDGLTDDLEAQLGTNPSDADTDGDGTTDLQELQLGTDPTTARVGETVDGVPTAFDGQIQPGETRTFRRGPTAPATAYLRIMGLVRSTTNVRIQWSQETTEETLLLAESTLEFPPRTYWSWGHDLGPQAIITEPAHMTVTQLDITVEPGSDSVFFSLISSGGIANGPRGFEPLPPELVGTPLDFNLLFAHGLGDVAESWDSFAILLERLSPDIGVIRTTVDGFESVSARAGQLARFITREDRPPFYAVGHSMGGLDLRYILTEAASGSPLFVEAADGILGVFTIATPHLGADLATLVDEFDFLSSIVDVNAPAIIDLAPGSRVLNELNEAFPGDVLIRDRTVPLFSLVFHAGETPFDAFDGLVDLESQAFGSRPISDIPSSRGSGPGSGRHAPFIPTRADSELESYHVLGRILTEIIRLRDEPATIQVSSRGD
jgi:pimeloyl-ACP methyl ester carboxylesterase